MIRKTSRAVNLIHATAKLLAGRNVLVCLTGLAARSTAVAQRAARTGLEVVIVPKASVGAVNVHALLQIGNVILMFVGTAGSLVGMVRLGSLAKEAIIMSAGI